MPHYYYWNIFYIYIYKCIYVIFVNLLHIIYVYVFQMNKCVVQISYEIYVYIV